MISRLFAHFKPYEGITLRVFRTAPAGSGDGVPKSYYSVFKLPRDAKCGPMVVDALDYIKRHIDPTLAYRRACCEGVCGSCAINVDGKNVLACTTRLPANGKTVTLRPLPHFRVVRDLVVDMDEFFANYKKVKPWMRGIEPNRGQIGDDNGGRPHKELRQSPKQRAALDGLYECIQCGCCSAGCPEYWWGHNSKDSRRAFLGPAALLSACRWLRDSRDGAKKKRIAELRATQKGAGNCHTILGCTASCPKGLNPAKAVHDVMDMLGL